jgi:hypothetical protein
MAVLVWDDPTNKLFETGLDRGVLYTSTGGVPWNGLISAELNNDKGDVTPLYFNGVKTFDLVGNSDFSGKLTAVTYPDEFLPFDGQVEYLSGVYLANQSVDTFGLSFRTLIGNATEGTDYAYKIHILYNLTATPDNKTAETIDDSTVPAEFAWDISSRPESVPGFRPTSHFSLDSRKVVPAKLALVEEALYGTALTDPYLPTVTELLALLS